ncbi:MAG: Ig-like domain-containing protein [Pirellulaceae bacterium]|nr:Ig-like domain-containing protein [Pirellulaceae bacterium]
MLFGNHKQLTRTSRMRRLRNLGFESLEGRKLLAATVGVYDENIEALNAVDFVATGSTLTNTQFAAEVAVAFARNAGGVIDGTLLASQYEFGVEQSKSIGFGPTSPETNNWGGGTPGDNRPISGVGAFATVGFAGLESFRSTTFGFGNIANGVPNEHVIKIGITALSLTGRDYGIVTTTAYLSGGGSVSASRRISEANSQGDTFFGLSAPAGEYITSFKIGYDGPVVSPDVRLWFDDIGFITNFTPNRAPVVQNDAYSVQEDARLSVLTPGVLDNDSDPDRDPLTAVLDSGPSHGTLDFRADGSFVYVPAANFNGVDRFIYFVSDGSLRSGLATVTLNVNPVNDAPVVGNSTFSIAENSLNGSIVGTAAAFDIDGDSVSFAITNGNNAGTFSINPVTGQIRVANTAALDFETAPVFTLTVSATDGGGLSGVGTVIVRLTDVLETANILIDIKPGDAQNTINVRSKGHIEVAILSTAQFNAQTVDVNSLRFGRTGNENSLSRNPSKGEPRYKLVDLNGDGRLDLLVTFEQELTGFRVGDTRGFLTGRTIGGGVIQGEDRVTTK